MLADEVKNLFGQYFAAAHKEGALDAKTKELMHLVLVLAMRCEP